MTEERVKRKLSAILSADVVGYSRLMGDDEAWTIQSLEENKKLISELIEEYEGRVVDAPPFSCRIRKEVNFRGNASNP